MASKSVNVRMNWLADIPEGATPIDVQVVDFRYDDQDGYDFVADLAWVLEAPGTEGE